MGAIGEVKCLDRLFCIIKLNREEKSKMNCKEKFRNIVGDKKYIKLRSLKKSILNIKKRIVWNKRYKEDLKNYSIANKREAFRFEKNSEYKILGEWEKEAGTLGPYFWQDLWAAQHVYRNNPERHYDIGSSISGFIGHLTSFRGTNRGVFLIDVRPLKTKIPGVEFVQGDAKRLENIKDNSVESLSSLCALEHFGLGRYGDEIDPEGCFKALREMQRILRPGGVLYLSVPVGREHVEFNAHRIFYPKTIINELKEMELVEFSTTGLFEDGLRCNEDINKYNNVETHGLLFGLFVFVKK